MSFRLDFVGVGAAKAGTTWLGQCLKEHPGVCMSDPKEVNYFGYKHVWPPSPTHYDKGLGWLEQRFAPLQPGQVRGEYSVGYLIDPQSPQLIYEHNPDVKIIIALRNPIDALYSFYFEVMKQYVVPESFADFLDEYPDFVGYGFYPEHVRRYQERFMKEQLHFIFFDDIRRDPAGVLSNLFSFVGVDSDYEPLSLTKRVNERREPKHLWLRDAIGGSRDFMRTHKSLHGLQEVLRKMGVEKAVNWIQEKNRVATEFVPMDESIRLKLQEIYAPHNEEIGTMLERDLLHWK